MENKEIFIKDNEFVIRKVDKEGYSTVVDSPKFIKKVREHFITFFITILLLSALPFIVGYIFYYLEYTKINTVMYCSSISFLIYFIIILLWLNGRFDKPWEGVVTKKDYEIRETTHKGRTRNYTVYVLYVKTNSGNIETIEEAYNEGYYYKHFKVGDRIKYHPKFQYYEKYDKTKDKEVLCPFCSSINRIYKDNCIKCGIPLIK